MLTETAADTASDLLWATWQSGGRIDALPRALRPASRAEGYAIQARLEGRSATPLFGWKIAATSPAGQAHIGVDGPLAGRILADMVVADGSALTVAGNAMRVAEPEFVFRVGRDLTPRIDRYTEAEVMGAVAGLHLGIEVPDSRFADFADVGAPALIADDACGHRFALGPEAPPLWRELDLASHRVHCAVAPRYEREGTGSNVLGDPRRALTWLVNELARHDIILRAGQYVTTGTCTVPLTIEAGDNVTANFGALGRMSLSFTE